LLTIDLNELSAALSPPPIPNIDALEMHISKATIPILYLLLESLGVMSLEIDHISSHLGLCMGIAMALRAIPSRVCAGELPLPLDMCTKHRLIQETVFRQGPEAPGLKDVVLEVATRANDHLHTARRYIDELRVSNKGLLNTAFCVFLPTVRLLSKPII
jgi:NADH dehydrogenase [ubiquinone] 1 alpha subcomplex assembly factor 6